MNLTSFAQTPQRAVCGMLIMLSSFLSSMNVEGPWFPGIHRLLRNLRKRRSSPQSPQRAFGGDLAMLFAD